MGELIQQCSMCNEKYQCFPFSHKYLLHQIQNHWSNDEKIKLSLLIEQNISTSSTTPVQETFRLIDNTYYTIITTIKKSEHVVECKNDELLLLVKDEEEIFNNYMYQMKNNTLFANDFNHYSENQTITSDGVELLCQICNKPFINKATLITHLKNIHNESENYNDLLSLPQPSLTISRNNEESVNSVTIVTDAKSKNIGGRPRKCHITEKPKKLTKSISSEYTCEICNKKFIRKNHFEAHKKQHEKLPSNKEKPINQKSVLTNKKEHLCPICGKSYPRGYHLKLHLYVHGDARPLECDICGKGFVIKKTLRDHMHIHTGERPYKCKFVGCDKSFKLASANRQHFVSVHSGIKRFECEYCDKRYAKKIHLQEHLRKHTGERPFSCEFCPMKFRLSVTKRAHTKTHTGERPFSCHICNKGFIKSHNLKIHLAAKKSCAEKLLPISDTQRKENIITMPTADNNTALFSLSTDLPPMMNRIDTILPSLTFQIY